MMRNTEVPQVMTMVEAALLRAATAPGSRRPIFLTPEGESDGDIARLRRRASIEVEFHSGSDRPVVGPAIVFAKRAVRRGLRWYLRPAFEQQSSFNHAVVDLLERARLENQRLRTEIDRLRRPTVAEPSAWPTDEQLGAGQA